MIPRFVLERSLKNSGSTPGATPAPENVNNLGEKMNTQIPSFQSSKKVKVQEEKFLEGEELKELLKKEVFIQELEGNPIGSLYRHLQEWEELGCSPTVVMWISDGTPLFFRESPISGGGRRNYVPLAAMKFANEELTRLFVIKAIEEDDGVGDGYIFPMGAVPKPHEPHKWRMICDITDHGNGPNNFMGDKPFKMETIDDLLNQIGKEWWAITFDLRAGFHHLQVHPDFRRWLRFMWAGKLFHFNVMPFGPKHSPWIFHKVVREFVLILRRGCTIKGCDHTSCRFRAAPHGVVIGPFVDDFCIAAATRLTLLRIRDEILVPLMQEMGWIRAIGKGCWEPAQIWNFLGLTIDTVEGKVLIPEEKLVRYIANIETILSKRQLPIRELASVAGKIVSVMRAFAPALIFLRSSFALIGSVTDGAEGWSTVVELTAEARQDLIWVRDHLRSCNGRFAWRPAQIVILATDAASSVGWGATLKCQGSPLLKAQGQWSQSDREQDIYILEMRAILNSIRAFKDKLRGKRIQILTDNMICRHTLPAGSRIQELRMLVKEIHHLVMSLDATIVDVAWIPTELNVIPDHLSRLIDTNDWVVTEATWAMIFSTWPKLTVDRFASSENARLPKFNTRFAHPLCQMYNCMAQDWSQQDGMSYACPPMAMIGQVLQLIAQQRSKAVVVVPYWPQQPWWPRLQRMMKKSIQLGSGREAFRPGQSGECAPWKNQNWSFLAVEVEGNGV